MVGTGAKETAERRLVRGRQLNGRGDWPGAQRVLHQGLRGLDRLPTADDDPPGELRARLLVTRALADLHVHGQDRALATLAEARAVAGGSRYAAALADVQESVICMGLGEWGRALSLLRGVRVTDLRVPFERIAVLLNRGLAEVTLLDLAHGRRDLRAALDLAREHDIPDLEFKVRHNLGWLEYFAGDLPAAIRLMRRADDMDVEVGRVHARHGLACVLLEAGLVAQAVVLLREAATMAREQRQRLEEGEVLLDLARAHLMLAEPREAAAAAGGAARAFASRRDSVRADHARLIRRAIELTAGIRKVTVRVDRVDCETETGRTGLRLLAEGRLRSGDLTGARAALGALPSRGRDGLATELYERFLWAWLADASGDVATAGRHLRAAATRLQQRQGLAQSLEVRAGLSVHGGRLAELDVGRALRSGRARDLYASVERWRAAAHRLPAVTPDADPEIAEVVSELRLLRHASRAMPEAERDRERVAQLERRLQQLSWGRAGRRAQGAANASYAEVRARLAESGRTLLVYVAHQDRRYCLVVDGSRAAVRELPAADLDVLADRLRRDVHARALARGTPLLPMLEKAVAASARALDEAAVAPVADLLADSVVVAPTRRLASCPWGMLPTLAERAVTVAPSVTRWCRPAPTRRVDEVSVLVGPGLRRVEEESAAVADAWRGAGATVALTPLATSRDVAAAFARPGLVHVAAHGSHEEQNPLFSSLRMADGPVFVHEIPHAAASHAVLSACDVGQSRVYPGDEPLGLTAALLALGVGSVVAAVSPLPDGVAADALAHYHRSLARGATASEALAAVRADVPGSEVLCLYGADWSNN